MFGNNQQQDQQGHDGVVQPDVQADVDTTTKAQTDGTTLDLPTSMGVSTTAPSSWPQAGDGATSAPVPAAPAAPAAAAPTTGDLVDIKQSALQQLAPLVDHLEQTPEERFRTTMMMIQATDDSSKLKAAYEAAQQIPDEKIRAQALLDVVNEINYFTQQHHNQEPQGAAPEQA
jgi:hypothetical protein